MVDGNVRMQGRESSSGLGQPATSDVALALPGDSDATILLGAQSEVERAGFDRPSRRRAAASLVQARYTAARKILVDGTKISAELNNL